MVDGEFKTPVIEDTPELTPENTSSNQFEQNEHHVQSNSNDEWDNDSQCSDIQERYDSDDDFLFPDSQERYHPDDDFKPSGQPMPDDDSQSSGLLMPDDDSEYEYTIGRFSHVKEVLDNIKQEEKDTKRGHDSKPGN